MSFGNSVNIILGYGCNYRCSHCVTSSGPDKKHTRLNDQEIKTLCQMVSEQRPEFLLFTGGEPTLFPEIINEIVSAHPNLDKTEVRITTNGWFGIREETTKKTLDQIQRLDAVQMSFDVFHGNESKISFVKNISEYCNNRKIEFVVTMCLSNPMDLAKAQPLLKDLNVSVMFQPIVTAGRALENNLSFYYPTFEHETLNKKCPMTSAVYIPQKGFTSCCSNIVYGARPVDSAIHSSIEEHATSSFYKDMSTLTMGELAKKHNVDTKNLPASLSHVCHLCEYIHSKAGS